MGDFRTARALALTLLALGGYGCGGRAATDSAERDGAAGNAATGATSTAGAPSCGGVGCHSFGVHLSVGASSGPGVLSELTLTDSGLGLVCHRAACGYACDSGPFVGDGHYTIELRASGYVTQSVSFDVTNPTGCGCQPCCPFFATQTVTLEPDGSPLSGCCADLTRDPLNCGACGVSCPEDTFCADATCTPAFSPCTSAAPGSASCDDYCQKQGKTCANACGITGTNGAERWDRNFTGCGDDSLASYGACGDSLDELGGARCCCR